MGHCVWAAGPAAIFAAMLLDLENQNAVENDLNIWIFMVIHGY